MWITMGKAGMLKDPSEKGLNRCINAMLNRGKLKKGEILTLYHLHRLNAKEAYRVLEALKAWAKRQGVSV
ncbi:phage protein GemA/Gp16 family protein [Nicoletella semolina]|uniref:phage protein GemA/Gp16 family protein n=1 Tax=Nicoletella semolina TaxID=271160 RepID=UPI0031329A1A